MWWSSLLSTLELKNAANRGKMPQTLLFSFNLNNQTKADLVKLTHPMASALAIICADIWWYMQVNHYIIYIYRFASLWVSDVHAGFHQPRPPDRTLPGPWAGTKVGTECWRPQMRSAALSGWRHGHAVIWWIFSNVLMFALEYILLICCLIAGQY